MGNRQTDRQTNKLVSHHCIVIWDDDPILHHHLTSYSHTELPLSLSLSLPLKHPSLSLFFHRSISPVHQSTHSAHFVLFSCLFLLVPICPSLILYFETRPLQYLEQEACGYVCPPDMFNSNNSIMQCYAVSIFLPSPSFPSFPFAYPLLLYRAIKQCKQQSEGQEDELAKHESIKEGLMDSCEKGINASTLVTSSFPPFKVCFVVISWRRIGSNGPSSLVLPSFLPSCLGILYDMCESAIILPSRPLPPIVHPSMQTLHPLTDVLSLVVVPYIRY